MWLYLWWEYMCKYVHHDCKYFYIRVFLEDVVLIYMSMDCAWTVAMVCLLVAVLSREVEEPIVQSRLLPLAVLVL